MKYIRTKDGRLFNKGKIICYAFREEYISPNWNEDIEKYLQTKIVAEADTIEELCDCYSYDTETTRDIAVACSWKLHNKEREIFGCIKTDKGLIYVAKMNDKGELEYGI